MQDARGSPTGEGFLQGAGGLRGPGAGGHHLAVGVQGQELKRLLEAIMGFAGFMRERLSW